VYSLEILEKETILIHFQHMDCVDHLLGDFGQLFRFVHVCTFLGGGISPKNTFITISTLSENRNTWEMDQS
jgi:hypothetical protein